MRYHWGTASTNERLEGPWGREGGTIEASRVQGGPVFQPSGEQFAGPMGPVSMAEGVREIDFATTIVWTFQDNTVAHALNGRLGGS